MPSPSQNNPLKQSSDMNNNDQVQKKYEELFKQYQAVVNEKAKLQRDINEIQEEIQKNDGRGGNSADLKSQYQWQQPEAPSGYSFQPIHLLITAIICLVIGGLLGGQNQEAIKVDV